MLEFADVRDLRDPVVIAAFEGCIKGANDVDTMTFWRLINLELWLREFFDDKEDDADATEAARAAHVKTDYEPNERRPLDLVTARGESVRRYPVRTELFGAGWPHAPHRVLANAATERWLGRDPRATDAQVRCGGLLERSDRLGLEPPLDPRSRGRHVDE